LASRFGQEALRYSLLTMSGLSLAGGVIFWRASTHYVRDLAPGSGRPKEQSS
jgi:hypothetical protein